MISLVRDLIVKDCWLKLFSLGLAGLVWFTVNTMTGNKNPVSSLPMGPTEKRTFHNLPVTIMSSAADVRSFRVSPQEIEVTVQGERKVIERLQKNEIRVLVDLTGIEGARDLRARIEVSTPSGVTHVKVVPEDVLVIFPQKS